MRRFFQDVNYGSTEVGRAVEEARLNQRRVALERQTANIAREYATYNADVSAHIRYNGLRDNNANLFLPMPSGWGADPTGASLHPSECWVPPSVPANPTGVSLPRSNPSSANPSDRLPSVQERPWEYNRDVSPAANQQPTYRPSPSYREMPVYPPLPPEPTQVIEAPQPDRAYNSVPRGRDEILYQGRLYAPVY